MTAGGRREEQLFADMLREARAVDGMQRSAAQRERLRELIEMEWMEDSVVQPSADEGVGRARRLPPYHLRWVPRGMMEEARELEQLGTEYAERSHWERSHYTSYPYNQDQPGLDLEVHTSGPNSGTMQSTDLKGILSDNEEDPYAILSTIQDLEERRKVKRQIRNRLSAKRARDRSKSKMEELHQENEALKDENARLSTLVAKLHGQILRYKRLTMPASNTEERQSSDFLI
mmetsp:Transcript_3996/g.25154  ORF Transcript_3996/g.25154 Transcript_3996/m.25154 type:complete len:231 (-) Transcript_3996:541-1233(-)|eukprot:CAMPEP_0183827636 /NCGR_PEP_ID=MMETSP0807_2-20130328/2352_1 /TAXON_ID=88271 /ORGANISM="Picocystis salinarum, Strain CCMP1897" /LENGTH=230 /DNA_ID=CAMNT_0026072805 /DNA_START=45 /DNA_END=737 /DNA_ORIENTATION=-